MKRFFIVLLFFSVALACRAQDVRRWSEGLPDWSGFRIANESDSASSYAAFTLIKEKRTVRIKGVKYHYLDVTSALLPYNSWVKADAMNAAELFAVQRDFDLMEYFARSFRDSLFFTTDKNGKMERGYVERFRAAQQQAHTTGDYSEYALPGDPFNISNVPYDVSNNHLGESIGLFSNMPFGSQGRLLFPSVGASLALEFGRERNGFQVEAAIGVSPFRNRYVGLRSQIVPYVGVFALYRRELFSEGSWRFSVYCGPGYSVRVFNQETFRTKVGGVSLCEGVSADYYLGRSVIFSTAYPEQVDRFLQFKLSFNQIYNALQQKLVPSVNLTAVILFQGSGINRRQP